MTTGKKQTVIESFMGVVRDSGGFKKKKQSVINTGETSRIINTHRESNDQSVILEYDRSN